MRAKIAACARSDGWSPICAMRKCDCKRSFNCATRRQKNQKKIHFRTSKNYCRWNGRVFPPRLTAGKNKPFRQLERVEARLSKWPLDGITWKQICGAVEKIYKRGQRGLAKTIKKPVPENFHAWRKRVKDLWYQLRILQPLNRVVLDRDGSRRGCFG